MINARKNIILTALLLLLFSASTTQGQEYNTILIVFDASGRMAEEVNGQSKFMHAVRFVEKLTDAQIPALFALTVFGSDEASGSESYFSPIPPGTSTEPAIIEALKRLEPAGMSPIASAIIYGSQSLPVNGNNYIILITDGVENAGGGPISVTELLMQRGLITRLDVVGFIEHVEENPLISGLINAGSGTYVPAWRAEALIEKYSDMIDVQIKRSRTSTAGYRCFIGSEKGFPAYGTTVELHNIAGQLIEFRNFWRGIFENLPEGSYTLTAKHGYSTPQTETIKVTADTRREVNFVFDVESGGFTFEHLIKNTANGKAYGTITKVYHSSGETVYTGISWTGEVDDLPVGEYKVEGFFEGLPPQTQKVTVTSEIKPKLTFNFDAGKGRISYKCFLNSFMTNVASGTVIRIYRQPYNELALERNQWRGTTPYLPIGSYTVEGNYKGIVRMENIKVHADSTSELNFIFNIQNVRFSYQCYRNEQKKTPANGVNFQILNQKGFLIEESNRWRGTFSLPEGVYTLRAQFEGKTKIQTLNLFASSEQIMTVFDFSK